ncbi:MAG: hypothetical protein WEA61_08485, partial [Anaerolineales bacterium]
MSGELKAKGLRINLGDYFAEVEAAIHRAESAQLIERIWARDHTVWNPSPTEISNRLGWLDIARRMRAEVPSLLTFTAEVRNAGMTSALLLGMGGSSLAPELFGKMFGSETEMKLSVLDSTDPDALRAKALRHNPNATLYIVSSKSGGTVETSSFFKYFYNLVKEKLGSEQVGKHFIAITDPGSGLAKTGEQYGFRRVFLADPHIGGRYSALSHFGLVPAALVGVDLERLLKKAEQMMGHCQSKNPQENAGALLGLALGTLALKGRDKVTFALPQRLASFADWAEQLIAESTGKQGKGILPVAGEPPLKAEQYGEDRVFVGLGEMVTPEEAPRIELAWHNNYAVGGLFFLW